MKNYLSNWLRYTVVFALGIAIAIPFATHALVSYPAGSLIQPGDVTGTIIRSATITANNIASSTAFTFASTTSYVVNTGALTATSTATLPASININGVAYTFTGSQGANGTALVNNGSGTVSWGASVAQSTIGTYTAGDSITAGAPVYVANGGTFITLDTNSYNSGSGTSLTVSHTVGTGLNRVLIEAINIAGNPSTVSCTYNSVSMQQILTNYNFGGSQYLVVFKLVSPAIGTHNIVCSWTGSLGWQSIGESYLGVSATAPIEAAQTGGGGGTWSTSLTTVTNRDWIVSIVGNTGTGTPNNGTNCTNRYAGTQNIALCDSNGALTPPGSYNLTGGFTGGSNGGIEFGLSPVDPTATSNTGTYVYNASAAQASTEATDIGIANSTVAALATEPVTMSGIATGLSGLTTGTVYYLSNTTGTLGTSAGTISQIIGSAISATSLVVNIR